MSLEEVSPSASLQRRAVLALRCFAPNDAPCHTLSDLFSLILPWAIRFDLSIRVDSFVNFHLHFRVYCLETLEDAESTSRMLFLPSSSEDSSYATYTCQTISRYLISLLHESSMLLNPCSIPKNIEPPPASDWNYRRFGIFIRDIDVLEDRDLVERYLKTLASESSLD